MATRWGIVSVGKTCHGFVSALKSLPSQEHQVVAVVSRSLERSKEFAAKFDIPNAYGSYEDMATNKNIDVVYIGCIHPMHLPLCKMYLNAGLNVLCEKPLTVNARETRELIQLAKDKQVFMMEAFWSRCFPIYEDLKNVIDSGTIGTPSYVTVNLGRNIQGMDHGLPRLEDRTLGGGVLLDMGCYTLQFVQLIFKGEKPLSIKATGCVNGKTGVDEFVTATLGYSNNRMAVITTSFTCTMDQKAHIYGSKADGTQNIITVPDFVTPEELITPHKTYSHPSPKLSGPLNFSKSGGLVYEAQSVRNCLQKGLKENPLMTLEESLQLQEIMDEIRQQIGVVYEADKTT